MGLFFSREWGADRSFFLRGWGAGGSFFLKGIAGWLVPKFWVL